MKMKFVLNACCAAIIAAAFATPAAAVDVALGTYVFEAADSSTQTYLVAIDPNGETAVTQLGIGFIEPCRVSGSETPYTLQTGWGLGGDYVIEQDGKVTFSARGNYYTFDVSLDFGAGGTAKGGSITTYGVTLYPADPESGHPKRALFCESAKQTVTLQSFTAPGSEPAISAPNTARFVGTAE
jgi:hypothetical protein